MKRRKPGGWIMAQRKHGFPQVAPTNLETVLRMLERGAVLDFSRRALEKDGIGQAKHVHALLRSIGFLDGSSRLTSDIQACRRQPQQLAARLRDGIVQRCATYAKEFGDLSFVFDREDDDAVRSELRNRLQGERSVSQVICSLMALRKEIRDRLERPRRDAPLAAEPARVETSAADPGEPQLAAVTGDPGGGNEATTRSPPSPAITSAGVQSGWRVDEVRDPAGALQTLKMHIRTPGGYVVVSACLEQGEFGGIEVVRGR
jgi:hypothetical protein